MAKQSAGATARIASHHRRLQHAGSLACHLLDGEQAVNEQFLFS